MGAFLPQSALPGLKKYEYASEDHSLISKYVLKPFYTKAVTFFPMWLAPNLVTLLGLFFSFASFGRAWYYNSDFNNFDLPSWIFYAYAFEIFAYQTLDALDGQQARRTGTSSPLGELFDHCVDALNTSLLAYVWVSIPNYPKEFVLMTQFLCTLNFYMSTWEEYHTHKLYLSVFSGPVEGVISIIICEVLTGMYGQRIWQIEAFAGLTWTDVHSVLSALGLVYNTYAAIMNVKKTTKKVHFSELAPFAVMWGGFGAWSLLAWSSITKNFLPYFLMIAFIFALLVGRIITAHVTNQPFPMWNLLLFIPLLGIASHLIGLTDSETIWGLCGLSLGIYGMFVAEIIGEITEYLGIPCLTIKEKRE